MQQFVVPQFIDVEDKIIGPISVRQFMTLLVSAALIFANYQLGYKLLFQNFWFFAISSIFMFALGGTFAFFKVNGRPFHYFLLNLFVTLQKPKLRVWNKRLQRQDVEVKEIEVEVAAPIPVKGPLNVSKLTELSLVVDTGGAYHEELPEPVAEQKKQPGDASKAEDIFAEI